MKKNNYYIPLQNTKSYKNELSYIFLTKINLVSIKIIKC